MNIAECSQLISLCDRRRQWLCGAVD